MIKYNIFRYINNYTIITKNPLQLIRQKFYSPADLVELLPPIVVTNLAAYLFFKEKFFLLKSGRASLSEEEKTGMFLIIPAENLELLLDLFKKGLRQFGVGRAPFLVNLYLVKEGEPLPNGTCKFTLSFFGDGREKGAHNQIKKFPCRSQYDEVGIVILDVRNSMKFQDPSALVLRLFNALAWELGRKEIKQTLKFGYYELFQLVEHDKYYIYKQAQSVTEKLTTRPQDCLYADIQTFSLNFFFSGVEDPQEWDNINKRKELFASNKGNISLSNGFNLKAYNSFRVKSFAKRGVSIMGRNFFIHVPMFLGFLASLEYWLLEIEVKYFPFAFKVSAGVASKSSYWVCFDANHGFKSLVNVGDLVYGNGTELLVEIKEVEEALNKAREANPKDLLDFLCILIADFGGVVVYRVGKESPAALRSDSLRIMKQWNKSPLEFASLFAPSFSGAIMQSLQEFFPQLKKELSESFEGAGEDFRVRARKSTVYIQQGKLFTELLRKFKLEKYKDLQHAIEVHKQSRGKLTMDLPLGGSAVFFHHLQKLFVQLKVVEVSFFFRVKRSFYSGWNERAEKPLLKDRNLYYCPHYKMFIVEGQLSGDIDSEKIILADLKPDAEVPYEGDTLAGYNVWLAMLDQRSTVSVEIVYFSEDEETRSDHGRFWSSRTLMQDEWVLPQKLVNKIVYLGWLCGCIDIFVGNDKFEVTFMQ